MIDLKILKQGIETLAEEKKLPLDKIKIAIEKAFASAYQKEYGEKGQIIKCDIDFDNSTIEFRQIKTVVSKDTVRMENETTEESKEEFKKEDFNNDIPKYNEERHVLIEDAKLFKKDIELGEEISFPLDMKDDFGRIALQNAKQGLGAAIKEAERAELVSMFEDKIETIVYGNIERVERGNVLVDIGKATAILPSSEQIKGEMYTAGNRIKAYFYKIEDSGKGLSIRLSRTHPNFLKELLIAESPELQDGSIEIVAIAREAGDRSKIAIKSNDPKIDPVGSCVGQRGTRINSISNELCGERIDIILWNENIENFIRESISPAQAKSLTIDEEEKVAYITVSPESLSLAIGKRGQNVRLAAKLTGYRLDIKSDEVIADEENNKDNNEDSNKEDTSSEIPKAGDLDMIDDTL
jgi:N utilization substance protein A